MRKALRNLQHKQHARNEHRVCCCGMCACDGISQGLREQRQAAHPLQHRDFLPQVQGRCACGRLDWVAHAVVDKPAQGVTNLSVHLRIAVGKDLQELFRCSLNVRSVPPNA
eukprot:CAMPEP_0178454762 /NCGR_PEP_ID=MMETSP0689_2-20121128/45545_1 /TAXON_ID=160604 /ORGANISM="Amphidinium massartii, Strain CS-259" /LENGTH=110 /DNA_ID=CAMNT_0020080745 /DNA_START=421 /DNA_END=753 /DNA_ORIENTATION=+